MDENQQKKIWIKQYLICSCNTHVVTASCVWTRPARNWWCWLWLFSSFASRCWDSRRHRGVKMSVWLWIIARGCSILAGWEARRWHECGRCQKYNLPCSWQGFTRFYAPSREEMARNRLMRHRCTSSIANCGQSAQMFAQISIFLLHTDVKWNTVVHEARSNRMPSRCTSSFGSFGPFLLCRTATTGAATGVECVACIK